jgi:tyrosine-protein kinase Etk/Wzc
MEKRQKEFNVKDYLNIILRRKYSILLIFLSIMGPLVFYVRTRPDTYFTKSQMVIEDLKSSSAFTPQVLKPSRSFNFYVGIFRSRSFLQEILDSIGLPAFNDFVKDTVQDHIRTFISSSINIQRAGYESFINISARSTTPQMAYDLAAGATKIFKNMCRVVVAEETENMVKETEKQLHIIRAKLEQAERDYREFGEKIGATHKGVTAELVHLQEKYYGLKSERASKEALYEANRRYLRMLEKKIAPKTSNKTNVSKYRKTKEMLRKKEKEKKQLESHGLILTSASKISKEIEDLEREIIRLRPKEERINPKVVGQWQKWRKVVAENETGLDLMKSKINVYRKKIDQYKKKHPDELSQTLEMARLERARKVYEDTYNILLEKVELAKIRRAAETGGLTVIDAVFYPDTPVPRNEAAYYIVGLVVSLILGLGFVFLREFLDTTIKSNDEIENNYDIPIIGTIPHIDFSKKKELQIKRKSSVSSNKEVTTSYPKELINFYKDESIVAESYRSLRTNLFFTSPDNPLRTLAVTSSGPHEGKSLTASNLGLACAQMGKRTLLVDSDLRRPVIHHLFQHPRENGFTDLFIGKDIKEIKKNTGLKNLDLITAGRFTPSPSELLASKKMEKLVEEMKEQYDLIVFDTPPVMAVTDAPLLSTKVDGIVMIIKSYSTDKNVLERAINSLQNVNSHITGFVLNDIDLTHRYASYGYYKYYYHYYRSQKD